MKVASREDIERRLDASYWARIVDQAVRAQASHERTRARAENQLRRLALEVVFRHASKPVGPAEGNPADPAELRRKILAIIRDDSIDEESAQEHLRRAIHEKHLGPLAAQGRREARAKMVAAAADTLQEASDGLDSFRDAVKSRAQLLGNRRWFPVLRTAIKSLARPSEKIGLGRSILRE